MGLIQKENWSSTVSAEALCEGGGVGDVVGRVLLWHQGDDWAVCYLDIETNKLTAFLWDVGTLSSFSGQTCVPDSEPVCWVVSSHCRSWLWRLHPAGWSWPFDPDAILRKEEAKVQSSPVQKRPRLRADRPDLVLPRSMSEAFGRCE